MPVSWRLGNTGYKTSTHIKSLTGFLRIKNYVSEQREGMSRLYGFRKRPYGLFV